MFAIPYPVFWPEVLHAFGTQGSLSSVNYDPVHFSGCHGSTSVEYSNESREAAVAVFRLIALFQTTWNGDVRERHTTQPRVTWARNLCSFYCHTRSQSLRHSGYRHLRKQRGDSLPTTKKRVPVGNDDFLMGIQRRSQPQPLSSLTNLWHKLLLTS